MRDCESVPDCVCKIPTKAIGGVEMNYRELFSLVHERPGMYGLDGSFKHFYIFVMGCDAGTSWSLLAGFREWLIVQLNEGDNLVWPALVELIALPSRKQICEPLDADENTAAVETLFRLLDEFLELRKGYQGLPNIFQEYIAWREKHHAK